jgi:general secretion pathway protein A
MKIQSTLDICREFYLTRSSIFSMYLKHFHLVEKPFEYLIPNPRYFWYTPQGEGIKAQCDYIIREKSGHLYISGPIGAGKTTLLKTLTQGLLTDNQNLINFINAPNLKTSNALLRRVTDGFGVKTERSYDDTLQNFTTWLKQTDRFPILIIDEAQNLVLDSLKTLHYFMTYVTDRLLMMIILCGQEEMVERINRFTAIRSRMFPAFLSALSRSEAEKMMQYRWKIASQNDAAPLPFTDKAIDDVFNYSKGVPRYICQAADVALLAAYNQQKHEVDDKIVKVVVNSLSVKEGGT